ncbi:MAG: DUF4349 domain-containing protein [Caldiserica bacterium]|jgi:hypothetical protein|nr:DUF4349 domain-containing protein [Caldisericota bacterium]MDH7563059.1 DUF4349 domain-containing protein [Caldisericota bacterium]
MKLKIIIPIAVILFLLGGYFLGKPLLLDSQEVFPSPSPEAPLSSGYIPRDGETSQTKEGYASPLGVPTEILSTSEESPFKISSLDQDSRVIKNASLALKVEEGKVKSTQEKVRAITQAKGGYVQSSQLFSGEDYVEAYIVINVPEDEFEGAIKELEGLGEVMSLQISGKDVSQEYYDLEMDLKHWETERQAVLALLDKAQTIDEIIKIRQFLEPIEKEINQIKGRLQYLQAKTDFSSIEVSIREKGEEEKPSPSIWAKIGKVFMDSLTGILAFLAAAVPFLILASFICLFTWWIIKSLKKRGRQAPPPQ